MTDKYQNFLARLQTTGESERDWLVMEFSLQNLSEVLRQAVWAAAIPHWFDHDFLNAVLANPLKDSEFQALTELSFFEAYPERGFNVHERSRTLLLNRLWLTNKARYQKLSKRAAAYCKKQDQKVAAWRIETLYHSLLADSLTAKDSFLKQGLDWINSFQYDNLESLTQVVLGAVNSSKLKGDVAGTAYFLQAKVDNIYSRYESAKKHLQLALTHKIQNKLLKANFLFDLASNSYCLSENDQTRDYCQQALTIYRQGNSPLGGKANCIYLLGNVHLKLAEYKLARDCYQQALAIYQKIKDILGEANCIRSLGDAHLHLAEYELARDCYQQALVISQKIKNGLCEAGCIFSLGQAHWHLGEYELAQNCYSQALLIYQQINNRLGEANCLKNLGRLQGTQSQIQLAIVTLQQAAELYEQIGNKLSKASCFNILATLYQRQKHFVPALAAFNQAMEIFPDFAAPYQNRAALYMQLDDYAKAETDIKQAEMMGKTPYTLLLKAKLALWQQQTAQAVEFCQQALAQCPANGNVRTIYALTLLADGQTQLACTEMEQALTAVYHKHDFDGLLDALDKVRRIYEDLVEVDALRELILNHCPK
jgi:tetratricopeptide (TPR) repeat protein